MYLVICYSVHNREVSSVDIFDDIDKARTFMCKDAKNCFDEEKNSGLSSESNLTIMNYEDSMIVNCDDDRIWTWEIIIK